MYYSRGAFLVKGVEQAVVVSALGFCVYGSWYQDYDYMYLHIYIIHVSCFF